MFSTSQAILVTATLVRVVGNRYKKRRMWKRQTREKERVKNRNKKRKRKSKRRIYTRAPHRTLTSISLMPRRRLVSSRLPTSSLWLSRKMNCLEKDKELLISSIDRRQKS